MKIKSLFVFLFLVSSYTYGQQFDLNTCNSITEPSLRATCLKSSLDNLILKELQKDLEMLRLQPGVPENLDLEIEVSLVGNFSIASIQTPNFAIARAVNVAIASIKPVAMYKDNTGNFTKSTLVISNSYTLTEGNTILVKDLLENQAPENMITEDPEYKPDVAFAIIEEVPVFPGCDGGNNEDKKKCMSVAIDQYVKENFNLSVVNTLNLEPGRHRISVQFKIDTNGYITEVLARAPHPVLEAESKRIIESLPKMKPGRQKGKEVNVMYSLPIIFQIEDDAPKEKGKKSRKS